MIRLPVIVYLFHEVQAPKYILVTRSTLVCFFFVTALSVWGISRFIYYLYLVNNTRAIVNEERIVSAQIFSINPLRTLPAGNLQLSKAKIPGDSAPSCLSDIRFIYGLPTSQFFVNLFKIQKSNKAAHKKNSQTGCPIEFGVLTSTFGVRSDPIIEGTAFHEGIDISAPIGTPVLAARSGVVVFTGWKNRLGNTIVLAHDSSYYTVYAHLNTISVSKNENVKVGSKIGTLGTTGRSTGPHLHFEYHRDLTILDPIACIVPDNMLID